jgi:hypothetical protein
MRIQEALKFVRANGFTTKKQDGAWWISKPYHNADMLRSFNGVMQVGVWQQSISQRLFVEFEEFREQVK